MTHAAFAAQIAAENARFPSARPPRPPKCHFRVSPKRGGYILTAYGAYGIKDVLKSAGYQFSGQSWDFEVPAEETALRLARAPDYPEDDGGFAAAFR